MTVTEAQGVVNGTSNFMLSRMFFDGKNFNAALNDAVCLGYAEGDGSVDIQGLDALSKMKAVASVTFDNQFVVHDIKVIESQNGLFIAMPSRKTPDGEFRDIAHPINSEMREKLQTAILEKFKSVPEVSEVPEVPSET